MTRPADWRDRAQALLDAIRDVAPPGHPLQTLHRTTGPHGTLYGDYLGTLISARREADAWWERLIAVQQERLGDAQQARRAVEEQWPIGPAAHPFVIAVIVRFWLRCVELNREVPKAQAVAPEMLVLGWMMNGESEDLARFLSALPFWPLGLDLEGRWI